MLKSYSGKYPHRVATIAVGKKETLVLSNGGERLMLDTKLCHGIVFAREYYLRRGMPSWEFNLWAAVFYRQPSLAI